MMLLLARGCLAEFTFSRYQYIITKTFSRRLLCTKSCENTSDSYNKASAFRRNASTTKNLHYNKSLHSLRILKLLTHSSSIYLSPHIETFKSTHRLHTYKQREELEFLINHLHNDHTPDVNSLLSALHLIIQKFLTQNPFQFHDEIRKLTQHNPNILESLWKSVLLSPNIDTNADIHHQLVSTLVNMNTLRLPVPRKSQKPYRLCIAPNSENTSMVLQPRVSRIDKHNVQDDEDILGQKHSFVARNQWNLRFWTHFESVLHNALYKFTTISQLALVLITLTNLRASISIRFWNDWRLQWLSLQANQSNETYTHQNTLQLPLLCEVISCIQSISLQHMYSPWTSEEREYIDKLNGFNFNLCLNIVREIVSDQEWITIIMKYSNMDNNLSFSQVCCTLEHILRSIRIGVQLLPTPIHKSKRSPSSGPPIDQDHHALFQRAVKMFLHNSAPLLSVLSSSIPSKPSLKHDRNHHHLSHSRAEDPSICDLIHSERTPDLFFCFMYLCNNNKDSESKENLYLTAMIERVQSEIEMYHGTQLHLIVESMMRFLDRSNGYENEEMETLWRKVQKELETKLFNSSNSEMECVLKMVRNVGWRFIPSFENAFVREYWKNMSLYGFELVLRMNEMLVEVQVYPRREVVEYSELILMSQLEEMGTLRVMNFVKVAADMRTKCLERRRAVGAWSVYNAMDAFHGERILKCVEVGEVRDDDSELLGFLKDLFVCFNVLVKEEDSGDSGTRVRREDWKNVVAKSSAVHLDASVGIDEGDCGVECTKTSEFVLISIPEQWILVLQELLRARMDRKNKRAMEIRVEDWISQCIQNVVSKKRSYRNPFQDAN